jgi:hypothetical protein
MLPSENHPPSQMGKGNLAAMMGHKLVSWLCKAEKLKLLFLQAIRAEIKIKQKHHNHSIYLIANP